VDRQPRHLTPAFAVSVVVHASFVVAALFLASHAREEKTTTVTPLDPVKLVWIPDPRPAARGGGGAPPKPATPPPPTPTPAVSAPESPKPVVIEEPQTIAPEPEPAPIAPPVPAVATTGEAPGPPSSTGVGNTPGPGVGNDRGPGGSGDGVFPIGNGVTAPVPLRRPPPTYTAEAMRARLQGVVVINCVVRPDGRCSDIRILKSLDMMFGLDQQAIASAREWVFRPGMRMGQPVSVPVTLEIGFTIR
jgi:periplasmic protein TonB